MKSTAKNVTMEQRADIKAIFAVPFIREMTKGAETGGVHVNMVGPIYVTHADGTRDKDAGIMQIDSGEHHELMLLRDVSDELPEIDEAVIKKFEPIFNKLPEPKLESAVRLVAETAHRLDGSVQSVAKALNCSIYKAKSVMAKFGLSS